MMLGNVVIREGEANYFNKGIQKIWRPDLFEKPGDTKPREIFLKN